MIVDSAIPSPDPSWASFSLGPLTIHTYALCIIAGIIAAVVITERRLRRRGVSPWTTIDIALWTVPLGIVVARFYHVFTHVGDYFYPGANLWNVFAIWDGGNAIYGSMIGGAVGIAIACRRTGLRFWAFVDALAPALLVAQAIGRLGNWFNQELFGLPTTLPWGLEISPTAPMYPAGTPAGTLFHPLFLYEIIWNLTGALLIVLLERRLTLQWGRSLGLYMVWYGLGRSGLEAIRIDPTSTAAFGIPANIWASFALIAIGVTLLIVQSIRHDGPEPSPYVDGRGPTGAVPGDSEADDAQISPGPTARDSAPLRGA
ncbi:MAG: prolipoprotein diacylglyceryl transferase [Microbacterium sp.]|uniref:prolipoprotein diacylglyceryl transferase n=1 Tax=Microbacterium sp. TaxID=51671 RepID=UPI001AD18E9F|nr:prolipoprotein diacylglyceryl transferase [Microbacterium sp.]MBN9154899.1 prolipoprotein diacylglyceryl transferase [Microbacterium sp.]MBN9174395.1 prolipoprotein diacylglyceryl transferase [Microbacterium sp.]